jgi:hypothetical protein
MGRTVHFVIAVDIDDKSVHIDDDTFTAKFHDGALYDEEKQEWREEDYETEYLPALELLNTVALAKE